MVRHGHGRGYSRRHGAGSAIPRADPHTAPAPVRRIDLRPRGPRRRNRHRRRHRGGHGGAHPGPGPHQQPAQRQYGYRGHQQDDHAPHPDASGRRVGTHPVGPQAPGSGQATRSAHPEPGTFERHDPHHGQQDRAYRGLEPGASGRPVHGLRRARETANRRSVGCAHGPAGDRGRATSARPAVGGPGSHPDQVDDGRVAPPDGSRGRQLAKPPHLHADGSSGRRRERHGDHRRYGLRASGPDPLHVRTHLLQQGIGLEGRSGTRVAAHL
jgi:hypothetical protein